MKRWTTFLMILIGLAGRAQNPQSDFAAANAAYQAKEYPRALELYQQVLEQGYESAALYYNLGNTYFKMGQTAESILHYERAARMAPYDEDVQQNLAIANRRVIDTFETLPQPLVRAVYLGVLKALSPSHWAWVAVVSLGLLLLGLAVYLFSTWRRPGFIISTLSLVVALAALSLAYAHASYLQHHQPAIIMVPSSYVKSAPSTEAEDAFILHEGTKVQVTDGLEAWKKIRLPDGKIGWINAADLTEV